MKAVCETIDVARSNIAERSKGRRSGADWPSSRARWRPGRRDRGGDQGPADLWLPPRSRRAAQEGPRSGNAGAQPQAGLPVMKLHGLLLHRHAGGLEERRHDGRVAVDRSNLRWCSDGFEIGCDNGEKVRVAFALDCCDREAIAHVATTEGIKGEDVRDLIITAVESRFGQVNRLPETIEWLSDNGSGYIAHETRAMARDIGLEPRTTPVQSPQSNGMAEAFVKTIKRDYVRVSPLPDARTVMESLPLWIEHYNSLHPHKALGYRSPREFIADQTQP